MQKDQINPYLRTRILTASPEELRLMLYDGAIKFCRQAEHALTQQKYEDMYTALVRAQKILLELDSSLNHSQDPDLCSKLSAIYNYMYRQLVEGNMQKDINIIRETIKLLEFERETWAMLMDKLNKELQATSPSDSSSDNDTQQNLEVIGQIQPHESSPQDRPSFSIEG